MHLDNIDAFSFRLLCSRMLHPFAITWPRWLTQTFGASWRQARRIPKDTEFAAGFVSEFFGHHASIFGGTWTSAELLRPRLWRFLKKPIIRPYAIELFLRRCTLFLPNPMPHKRPAVALRCDWWLESRNSSPQDLHPSFMIPVRDSRI